MTLRQGPRQQHCLFWDCGTRVQSGHQFCSDHYQNLLDGLIDECPGCGKAKDRKYEVCLDCKNSKGRIADGGRSSRYRVEHSPAWEAKDKEADQFFTYILKLDGGEFYAGQTRELRERLSEHRDGKTRSTKGTRPKLVWFAIHGSREDAAKREAELKRLIDKNPREIRRMMVSFQDLVRELDYS